MKRKVCKITEKEFYQNADKYMKLGTKEKVIVTKNGITSFVLTKKIINGYKGFHSLLGILPKEIYDELYPEKKKENII